MLKLAILNMNTEKDYTSDDLRYDVRYLKRSIGEIKHALYGSKNSPKPEGVIHEVHSNTKFRERLTKWLWILVTQLTIIIVYLIYNSIK
jgi:hypothetical protein